MLLNKHQQYCDNLRAEPTLSHMATALRKAMLRVQTTLMSIQTYFVKGCKRSRAILQLKQTCVEVFGNSASVKVLACEHVSILVWTRHDSPKNSVERH